MATETNPVYRIRRDQHRRVEQLREAALPLRVPGPLVLREALDRGLALLEAEHARHRNNPGADEP